MAKIRHQFMNTAPEWTKTLHYRIINDEYACRIYQNNLELANQKMPHFLYQLLLESVKNHINSPSEVMLT
jgi:hypothetical protein